MTARRLRREVAALARESGVREAAVEAAEDRHEARCLLQSPPPDGPSDGIDPRTLKMLTEATELLEDDTLERWRADHELLVADQLERYGDLKWIERRKAWGASPEEFVDRFVRQWQEYVVPDLRRRWRRHVEREMWRRAADGPGETLHYEWRHRHRERLDQEIDDDIDPARLLCEVMEFDDRDRKEHRRHLTERDRG